MKHIAYMMYMAVFTVLFCVAIALIFYMEGHVERLQKGIYRLTNKDVANEGHVGDAGIWYDEADILCVLMIELEYDVEVNGTLFKKNEYSPTYVSYEMISKGTYVKRYMYDSEGKVVRVIYTLQ